MMNKLWKQERLTDEWPKECSTDFLTGKAKMLADGIRDIIDENLHLRPTISTAQYDDVPSDERLAEMNRETSSMGLGTFTKEEMTTRKGETMENHIDCSGPLFAQTVSSCYSVSFDDELRTVESGGLFAITYDGGILWDFLSCDSEGSWGTDGTRSKIEKFVESHGCYIEDFTNWAMVVVEE
tara:strand:- start:1251 stop:1796 length:546 start_codon:yes stop_codon:yes gene_type:complete